MLLRSRSFLSLAAALSAGALAASIAACGSSGNGNTSEGDGGGEGGLDATSDSPGSGGQDGTTPSDSSGMGETGAEAATESGPGADGGSDGPTDGPTDAPHDAADGGFVMAPHPPLPVVSFNTGEGPKGSGVLTAPKVVTITFDSDPYASQLAALGNTYTSSSTWDTIRPGFCDPNGGPCMGDGPPGVNVDAGALAVDDAGKFNITQFLHDGITSGLLPAPDTGSPTNTIYMLVLPEEHLKGVPGLCSEFFGYHSWFEIKGQLITYAITGECKGYSGMTALDFAAQTINHEVSEASSDPANGYHLPYDDINDYAWSEVLSGGGEIGDLCDWYSLVPGYPYWPGENIDYTDPAGTVNIQRIWSPRAAAAGGDPCLPIPAGVTFFQVAPTQQVYVLDIGTSLTIDAVAYSTAAVPDWTLEVRSGSPALEVSLEGVTPPPDGGVATTQVNNGDRPKITLKLTADPGKLSDAGVVTRGTPAVGVTHSFTLSGAGKPTAAYEWPFAVMTPADAIADGIDSGISMRPRGDSDLKAQYGIPPEAKVHWAPGALRR